MVVKLLVSVLMLPVALFVTALLEAVWLVCIAGLIVLGLPIVIIAAMFGGRLSDEMSEALGGLPKGVGRRTWSGLREDVWQRLGLIPVSR
ncbi:hypothetical protein OG427_38970 [Streptomyces sp. NBC_00133]|uniref:hypothetical protein n=1 Tax=Streptomyces sp. NBC_00133 TaxID=2903624 RepID=UPI0032544A36